MSELIVVNYLSLDGRFDYGDWIAPYLDDKVVGAMSDATVQASGMLLGRRTYENFAAIWPDADESEAAVAAMNRMPKYVASTTLHQSGIQWSGTKVLEATDIPAEIKAKKEQHDGYLVTFGSGQLIQTLRKHDLIDEYRLLVLPILRGSGTPLFQDNEALAGLRLAGANTSPSGVLIATYRRNR